MFERKIYRIYDCGNVRWELDVNWKRIFIILIVNLFF
jgi:hypothetical protein